MANNRNFFKLNGTVDEALSDGHVIAFGIKSGNLVGFVTSPTPDGISGEFGVHLMRDWQAPAGLGLDLTLATAMSTDEAADAIVVLKRCREWIEQKQKWADRVLAEADSAGVIGGNVKSPKIDCFAALSAAVGE